MDKNLAAVTTSTPTWDAKLIWNIKEFEETLNRDKKLISPNLRLRNDTWNRELVWQITLESKASNLLLSLNLPEVYYKECFEYKLNCSYEVALGNPCGASIEDQGHEIYTSTSEYSSRYNGACLEKCYRYSSPKNQLTFPMGRITGQREKIYPNGTLRIAVDLHMAFPQIDKPDERNFPVLQNGAEISADEWTSNFFNNSLYSDVTVKSQDRAYYCHRHVLGRSSVFAPMISTGRKEPSSKEIIISDVESSILDIVLKYLYCQPLNLEMDYKELIELMVHAKRFDLVGLTFLCLQKLSYMITDENAGEINIAAHKCCQNKDYTKVFKDYCLKRQAILKKDPAYRKIYVECYEAFI